MRLRLDGGANPGNKVSFRIEHTLQEVLDLGFLAVSLDFQDLLEDVAFLKNFQSDVIQAEV